MITIEQKLQAIIETQVRGGFKEYECWLQPIQDTQDAIKGGKLVWLALGGQGTTTWCEDVLRILIEPEGLKAAYGEELKGGVFFRFAGESKTENSTQSMICPIPCFQRAAYQILDSWLSGGVEQAIETAYELLPSTKVI